MNNTLEGTIQQTNTSTDMGIAKYTPEYYIISTLFILGAVYVAYSIFKKGAGYLNNLAKKAVK